MATIRDPMVRDHITPVCGYRNGRGPVFGGLAAGGSREPNDVEAKVQVDGDDDRRRGDVGRLDGIFNFVSFGFKR